LDEVLIPLSEAKRELLLSRPRHPGSLKEMSFEVFSPNLDLLSRVDWDRREGSKLDTDRGPFYRHCRGLA